MPGHCSGVDQGLFLMLIHVTAPLRTFVPVSEKIFPAISPELLPAVSTKIFSSVITRGFLSITTGMFPTLLQGCFLSAISGMFPQRYFRDVSPAAIQDILLVFQIMRQIIQSKNRFRYFCDFVRRNCRLETGGKRIILIHRGFFNKCNCRETEKRN